MKRLVAALLDCLPFDARSRRALDETLLDWAHEEAGAESASRRLATRVHALAAVARALLVASLSEVGRVPVGWLAGRLALFLGIPALLATLWQLAWAPETIRVAGYSVIWITLPPYALLLAPPALFLTIAWRPAGRRVPPIGAAMIVAALFLALSGWMMPLLFQAWREHVFHILTAPQTGPPPTPGFSEMSVVELGRVLVTGGWPHVALDQFLRMTGYPALCATAVLLAGAVVRRAPRGVSGWWWLPAATIAYVSCFVLIQAGFFLEMRTGGGFGVWLMTVLMLVLSIAFTLDARRDAAPAPPLERQVS